MKKIAVFIFIVVMFKSGFSQSLERRAFLGIQMEVVTDEVQRVMNLPSAKGILISRVIPGSTAEMAGFEKGDILLKIESTELTGTQQVVDLLKNYRSGQQLNYTLYHNGKTLTKKVTVQGLLRESYAGLEVIYSSVRAGDSELRTIITKPAKSGKLPAILFIQGIGCYSLDSPLDSSRSEIQLFNQLARKGFVVMRVDKSGIGDSKGMPCEKIDFNAELEGYMQAFASMKRLEYVDTSKTFILGHSMGGVMAPLIAKKYSVAGIVAYGTIGVNFMEYWINTRKTIGDAYQMDDVEKDDYIKEQTQCAALLLNARMTKEEAVKINPECAATFDVLLLRDYQFWYQLYDVNIPGNWRTYPGKVLAMWGSTDFIAAKQEHQFIAEVVNGAHPGNATFMVAENSSHAMQTAATFSEARTNPGPYNRIVGEKIGEWLTAQL